MPIKSIVKQQSRIRRKKSIRKNMRGTAAKPRLTVFRSNKEIYAQIVDDIQNVTLVAASTQNTDVSSAKNKTEKAQLVGKQLGALAKEKNIEKVVFDRAGYIYHGRVKALADGAREAGLDF